MAKRTDEERLKALEKLCKIVDLPEAVYGAQEWHYVYDKPHEAMVQREEAVLLARIVANSDESNLRRHRKE